MLDVKTLGNNIKAQRKKRGLTQQVFADVLGVSFQAVSNWERGIAPPDLENTLAIASYFGVLVDDLFRSKGAETFLGIDGGGTKTELAVVSSDGYVFSRAVYSGCNPNDLGFSKTLELLGRGISDMLVKFPSIKHAFLGVAGAGTGDYAKRLEAELRKQHPNITFKIKNDAHNIFAIDKNADMAVISGTGSVVFARDKDGYKRLGGWGYLLDDAGSAFGIGRDALREALFEEDMHEEMSLLSTLLLKKLNTATVWEHVNTIYSEGRSYIASLSSVVFDAYSKGDLKAKEIVDKNAKALARLLNAGVEIYGAKPVAIASGGIFEHHKDIICRHIAAYSSVRLVTVDLPQIFGACKEACSMAGYKTGDEFYDNFKKTYGGIEK